jgi:hypothetical protein
MDFVAQRLSDGRWIRVLTVVDQYTRECLTLHADTTRRIACSVCLRVHRNSGSAEEQRHAAPGQQNEETATCFMRIFSFEGKKSFARRGQLLTQNAARWPALPGRISTLRAACKTAARNAPYCNRCARRSFGISIRDNFLLT